MATKKTADIDPVKLSAYEKLISSYPAIQRKGDTIPYTSHNGNMFSLLAKDGSLGFRLSKEDREGFLKKYPSAILFQYGIVMKEYVSIPDEVIKKPKELKKYFDQSWAYVQTLKAKPTTKAKAAKKKK